MSMELRERLLKDDKEDYHDRNDRSSKNIWWNGEEAVDETSILEMGQHRKQVFFANMMREEAKHKTSVLQNYILQRKKVHLSRICFGLATYGIVFMKGVSQGYFFTATALGALLTGCWYDMHGWYSALCICCAALGLGSILMSVNTAFTSNYLQAISLFFTAFGSGGMYPIAALLSKSLSSIKASDRQIAITYGFQYWGYLAATWTVIAVLVLVTQADNSRDYLKPSDNSWITCTGAVAALGASMYLQYLA